MKIRDMELDVNGVYEPMEDSILLAEIVEKKSRGEVLDVGTGSGFQSFVASKKAKHVTGVDIRKESVKTAEINAKRNNVKNAKFTQSDLFERVSGRFDVIIFNPPYLPEKQDLYDGSEQWAGGETGREVIKRFSSGVSEHLNENGKILMVVSSLTGLEEVKKIFQDLNFSVKVVRERKIPWETLYVLEIY